MPFQLKLESHWGIGKTREAKGEALRRLESALGHGPSQVRSSQRIYISVSDMEFHTEHDFGDVLAFCQTMDKSVSLRIEDLVREGITSVQKVRKCVHYHVHDVPFAGKGKPNDSCRTFFPTNADVRNLIQAALTKDRFSLLDQVNAQALVENYKAEQQDSTFFIILTRPVSGKPVKTTPMMFSSYLAAEVPSNIAFLLPVQVYEGHHDKVWMLRSMYGCD